VITYLARHHTITGEHRCHDCNVDNYETVQQVLYFINAVTCLSWSAGWLGFELEWSLFECGRRPPDGDLVSQPAPRVAARSAPTTFWPTVTAIANRSTKRAQELHVRITYEFGEWIRVPRSIFFHASTASESKDPSARQNSTFRSRQRNQVTTCYLCTRLDRTHPADFSYPRRQKSILWK
jgi:hypothetical protein